MWLNLGALFKRLSHDPNVRCVVLSGAGDRAFTAGLDVQVCDYHPFQADSTAQGKELIVGHRQQQQEISRQSQGMVRGSVIHQFVSRATTLY